MSQPPTKEPSGVSAASGDSHLLLIENALPTLDALVGELSQIDGQTQVRVIASIAALVEALAAEPVDAIICAYQLPDGTAQAAYRKARELGVDVPFVVMADTVDEQVVLEAMRLGIRDCVARDNPKLLATTVARELRSHRERKRSDDDRRTLERQVQESQKLEAIGRLAGGVAHDFNNLLTAIITFTRFAIDDMSRDDPRREDLAEVLKAADRAASLTSQLLAFSRRRTVEPRVVSINQVVLGVDKLLRRTLGEQIEVVCLPAESLWSCLIDPGQLEQVILNLAVNAKDAMRDKAQGTLTVQTQNVTIAREGKGLLPAGDYVVLQVEDTGCGMTEEIQERIFEPFFTTKGNQGSGLGLATCFGIIKQAGGHIDVRTSPGEGTAFMIYLPRAEAHPEEGAPLPGASGDSDQAHGGLLPPNAVAMVVEDQPAVLRSVARVLEGMGFNVLTASSGEDAISQLESESPALHLLVCDMMLPGMAGAKVVRRVRGMYPNLPVLVMSGYLTDEQEPLDDDLTFIAKPFTPHEMARKVWLVLSSHARTVSI